LVTATATAIPLLELGVGFMAVTRFWPVATSLAVLVLAASFTALTGWALIWRPRVACRCFGTLTDSQFSRRDLVRSALLTVTAALVLWYEAVRAPALAASAGWSLMLLLGFAVFALAAAQAATTLSALKGEEERRTA
ncbi:MAG: MauE/DoxX family redox-associated membrane protein, partial [Thermomicrobiales bacterium]